VLLMRDRGDCQGALGAFDQYERATGPVLPQGSPVPALIRECQEQLEQARGAAEAGRQLRAEAEKKAAESVPPPPAEPSPDGQKTSDIAPPPAAAPPPKPPP
jgi:hypothetical protein